MNVTFSLDNYDHGTGGAEMCARAIAEHLVAHGHTVHVLQVSSDERQYEDKGVTIHTRTLPTSRLVRNRGRDTLRWNRAWRPVLERFLSTHPTDLLMTQNRLLYSSVSVARERGIPSVVYVLAYGMFCPTQFRFHDALSDCDKRCEQCLSLRERIRYGTTRQAMEQYEEAMRRADLIIACSGYVQQVIRRFYDLDSEVVYPGIELEDYRAEGDPAERGAILFIKPQYVKGFPIFCDVAKRMPERRFLVAGRPSRHARLRLSRLPNAECLGWISDMRAVYARARVLLGPSIWPEPFGRVFPEAAAGGVPSVASARGGIPEAVGDPEGLVEDIFDIDQWVEALRRLDNPAFYAERSARALAAAERFSGDTTYRTFADCVHKAIGIRL